MQKHVWIIDDEQAICWALKKALEQSGYSVSTFSNAEDALQSLPKTPQLDAVMIDMRMPGMDGFEATAEIKKSRPNTPVIMMTAFGDLSSAVQAMELDIFEYLTKPFNLADGLKAVSKAVAMQSPALTASQVSDDIQHETLLGSSRTIQTVYKQIALAAKSEVSVLIQGPSGAGKESIASAIHRYSDRKNSPFVVFSPISIPPIAVSMELLGSSSELTSASSRSRQYAAHHRTGAFELAGKGVLYIEEVGDLPLSLQAQLLKVLEHQQFSPLGSNDAKHCDARIIVSSSKNLASLVADGELLDELRHRLSVFVIDVKALADRREDIIPIANAILKHENAALHFSDQAAAWLESRPWLGNIRELRSAIRHAVVLTRGNRIELDALNSFALSVALPERVDTEDFSQSIRDWTLKHLENLDGLGLKIKSSHSEDMFGNMYEDFLSAIEPPFLEAMMQAFQGNRAAIAAQLGLHRSTLRQKMRRYKIE